MWPQVHGGRWGICLEAHAHLHCWGGRSKGHTDLFSHMYNCSLTCSMLKDTEMELCKSSHMENASQHCCSSSAFLLLCPLPGSICFNSWGICREKALAHSLIILLLHLTQYKQKAKAMSFLQWLWASLVGLAQPTAVESWLLRCQKQNFFWRRRDVIN